MYLIFAFLVGVIHAAEPTVESLYRDLLNTPPRGTARRTTETATFAARLRLFLELRARANAIVPITPLVDAMVKYAEVGHELSQIFATLVAPDNGLAPAEVAALMMSGRFTEPNGLRLGPARAFERAYGVLPTENLAIDKRQFEIFASLSGYAADLDEWQDLASHAAEWTTFASLVSDVLVSKQIEKLQAWKLTATKWGQVLSLYRPEFIDPTECDAIVKHFAMVHGLLRAVARVPEAQVRLCLQEAAVRGMKTPTEGLVRTVLRPLGANVTAQYRMSLERLEKDHLKRAWRTGCGELIVAAVNDDPRLPPRPQTQTFLKVIEGGLK